MATVVVFINLQRFMLVEQSRILSNYFIYLQVALCDWALQTSTCAQVHFFDFNIESTPGYTIESTPGAFKEELQRGTAGMLN